MTLKEIAILRLSNQQLSGTNFRTVKDVVAHLGAMQAQDFPMAKWAVGARLPGATDETVEKALDNAEIIRTHILRPTWHFVAAEDLRWMLALTAPHIQRRMATYYRQLGMSEALCAKSNKIIARILEGRTRTRGEIMSELKLAGIPTDELRSTHLMFHAELEGVVCSGPRREKQHTYALIDERIPSGKPLRKEEALAELARRYFHSHGPATLQDYSWWSGLPAAEARAGLEMAKPGLICEKIEGKEYWFKVPGMQAPASTSIHFLPAFDEFMVAYTDRRAALDPALGKATIT
ncbi:MAG: winged helix DNA-binding domain-containing protein, partial [Thermoanaerobaculia bacterium]|nr:winged helix DNA-binding domain-containing protein [Thermoanaerobaculia bacterium]